ISAETKIKDVWKATMIFAAQPGAPNMQEAGSGDLNAALNEAMGQLDAFPALMWRNGKRVLQGGWHEEISAERKLGTRGKLQIAGFHDDNSHVAIFGRGNDLPNAEFFQDVFSNGFAYDGGSMSSWGARVALQEKLSEEFELTALYAFGGVLSPAENADGILRDSLKTSTRNSLGMNATMKVPRAGTKLTAGYKWISGPALSRLDSFGESLYQ